MKSVRTAVVGALAPVATGPAAVGPSPAAGTPRSATEGGQAHTPRASTPRPARRAGTYPPYSSSVTCAAHSDSGPSPSATPSVIDRWVMKSVGVAPCQCHSSGGE